MWGTKPRARPVYEIRARMDTDTYALFHVTFRAGVFFGSYPVHREMKGGFRSPQEAGAYLAAFLSRKERELSFDSKGRRL